MIKQYLSENVDSYVYYDDIDEQPRDLQVSVLPTVSECEGASRMDGVSE